MPRPESHAGDASIPVRDPRREILTAASALLYESGSEGLTIRRLALRCGYTAPAIYHIFGDKAGLLDAILREAIDELFDRIAKVPEHAEPRERIRMQFRECVRFGREHPTNYRLIEALRPDQVPPIVDVEATTKRLNEPLERVARESEGSHDVEMLHQALWALLHGLIQQESDFNPSSTSSAAGSARPSRWTSWPTPTREPTAGCRRPWPSTSSPAAGPLE